MNVQRLLSTARQRETVPAQTALPMAAMAQDYADLYYEQDIEDEEDEDYAPDSNTRDELARGLSGGHTDWSLASLLSEFDSAAGK